MKNLRVITTGAIILLAIMAKAQNEQDILRYSFTNVVGSARSMACGNAFGALGADYSSMVTNPAGLARYRSSEIGLTVNFFNTKANSYYIDNTKTDSKFNLNINNVGLAIAIPSGNTSGWRYVNLGFGVNRIANFNKTIYLEGINPKSSIVQHFEQTANGTDYTKLGVTTPAYLAYNAYLLSLEPGYRDQYISDFTYDSSYFLNQRNNIEQSGGMNDISLALSGNYEDKVYLGGSLNFYKVKFNEQNVFLEEVLKNSVDNYIRLSYTTNLKTRGTGIGAKIGAIFLPTNFLRIGIAYHTPSRIFLEDNYNSTLSSLVKFTSFTVDTSITKPAGNKWN